MNDNKVARRGYRSFSQRVLATLLLLSLCPLLLLGLFCLNRINAIYDEKIQAGLEAVTNNKRRALDTFLVERIAQIKTLAFTHTYSEFNDQKELSRLFTVMQNNSQSYVDIGVIGIDGRHLAYVGPFDLGSVNYSEADWFLEVKNKGVVVSDVFLGYRQIPHFIIAVLRHEGEHTFILRATLAMEALDELLRREYSGSHSDAFLVNTRGILQTNSLNYGAIMASFDLPDFKQISAHGIITTDLQPVITEESDDSQKLLAAMTQLESMPWILVVVDDVYENLQSLRQLQLLLAFFLIVGLVAITFGAVWCTRHMVTYLGEFDVKQAKMDALVLQSSKMAALGKMAAGVAHEVNNPLMLIQENTGWIRDLLDDEDPHKINNYTEIVQSLQKIEQHVKRAKGITQRMLGFGRRMNPGRTEVLLNTLAEEACEMFKAEAKSRNITILCKLDPKLPVIYSDPSQLEQVFVNILDNAIDAIDKNGQIEVRTMRRGKQASIAFADNGPGMDEMTRKRIFDPFFTTKKIGEGTGLGLAICFSILEKLGGRIEVISRIGQGTTFTLLLPHEPPVLPPPARLQRQVSE